MPITTISYERVKPYKCAGKLASRRGQVHRQHGNRPDILANSLKLNCKASQHFRGLNDQFPDRSLVSCPATSPALDDIFFKWRRPRKRRLDHILGGYGPRRDLGRLSPASGLRLHDATPGP